MKIILVDYEDRPIILSEETDSELEEMEINNCIARVRAAVAQNRGEGQTEITLDDLMCIAYLQGTMDLSLDLELEEEELAFQALDNKGRVVH